MHTEHRVLIGPGLDGRIWALKFLTKNWQEKHGLTPQVLLITWKDGEHFVPKLNRILKVIDKNIKEGHKVSLIGCSASGSAMLNAFVERKNEIHKVVNVDGFLRPGNAKGLRSFETRTALSITFKESVLRFLKLESKLTAKDKKKILTIRPQFGDELVPSETVVIQGALNKTVPMGEHLLSIALALILYDPVISFLKS